MSNGYIIAKQAVHMKNPINKLVWELLSWIIES